MIWPYGGGLVPHTRTPRAKEGGRERHTVFPFLRTVLLSSSSLPYTTLAGWLHPPSLSPPFSVVQYQLPFRTEGKKREKSVCSKWETLEKNFTAINSLPGDRDAFL